MFEQFSDGEIQEIYRGLKMLIGPDDTKDIFHDRQPRHSYYAEGMLGHAPKGFTPEKYSQHFKMLSALSKELKKRNLVNNNRSWWNDFSDWKDYCKFVFEAYDADKQS